MDLQGEKGRRDTSLPAAPSVFQLHDEGVDLRQLVHEPDGAPLRRVLGGAGRGVGDRVAVEVVAHLLPSGLPAPCRVRVPVLLFAEGAADGGDDRASLLGPPKQRHVVAEAQPPHELVGELAQRTHLRPRGHSLLDRVDGGNEEVVRLPDALPLNCNKTPLKYFFLKVTKKNVGFYPKMLGFKNVGFFSKMLGSKNVGFFFVEFQKCWVFLQNVGFQKCWVFFPKNVEFQKCWVLKMLGFKNVGFSNLYGDYPPLSKPHPKISVTGYFTKFTPKFKIFMDSNGI